MKLTFNQRLKKQYIYKFRRISILKFYFSKGLYLNLFLKGDPFSKVPPRHKIAKNSRPRVKDMSPLCNFNENFSLTNSSGSNITVAKQCHCCGVIIDKVVEEFWTILLSPLLEDAVIESLQAILSIASAAAKRK